MKEKLTAVVIGAGNRGQIIALRGSGV